MMATCDWCEKEMNRSTKTCAANNVVEYPDGCSMPPIPYSIDETERCHDCLVAPGGFHHPGCDMEECPRCGGQLISCGCLDEDEDDEDDEDTN